MLTSAKCSLGVRLIAQCVSNKLMIWLITSRHSVDHAKSWTNRQVKWMKFKRKQICRWYRWNIASTPNVCVILLWRCTGVKFIECRFLYIAYLNVNSYCRWFNVISKIDIHPAFENRNMPRDTFRTSLSVLHSIQVCMKHHEESRCRRNVRKSRVNRLCIFNNVKFLLTTVMIQVSFRDNLILPPLNNVPRDTFNSVWLSIQVCIDRCTEVLASIDYRMDLYGCDVISSGSKILSDWGGFASSVKFWESVPRTNHEFSTRSHHACSTKFDWSKDFRQGNNATTMRNPAAWSN